MSAGLSRRSFLALSGGVGSALALAACSSSSKPPGAGGPPPGGNGGSAYNGPKVTIKFWNGFTGADGDTAKKMIGEFNAQTSNIHVDMAVYKWEDFFQKLPAAVQSGNGPDVAAMHLDDMPTQAAQQVIVPIDDVATALGPEESDFSPAVWQGGMYNGKRYAIPVDVHCLGLYYNKTVMASAGLDPAKPPQTGDEYIAALETLKGKGIQGSWVPPFQFTGGFWFESLLWQFGADAFDQDVTKATWDSDAGVQALTWMVELIDKGLQPAQRRAGRRLHRAQERQERLQLAGHLAGERRRVADEVRDRRGTAAQGRQPGRRLGQLAPVRAAPHAWQ